MPRPPHLSSNAKQDLRDIFRYISDNDCRERATYVVRAIQSAVQSLSDFPERGVRPRELVELGRNEYREIHFKPYRIFYHVQNEQVTVLLITDGRRDMRTLLRLRILT